VNDLVLDPDDAAHNTLYAATDSGVFVTTNGGTTWFTMGTGLPNVPVLSLVLHEPSRTLLAATHGRSAWDYALPSLGLTPSFELCSLSTTSASAGRNAPLEMTLSGRGFTSSSRVLWNGSSTGLNIVGTPAASFIVVDIPANFFAQPGNASLQVMDSSHSPNTTNALVFSIPGSLPVLTGLQPSSVSAGSADSQILLNGSNFAQAAQVTFNGTATGVVINSVNTGGTQIAITLSHTLLQFGGEFVVGITNPPPGGGQASPGRILTVNSAGPPANDNFANATIVNAASFGSTIDNFAATSESTDPTPSCVAATSHNPTGKSVWWEFTPGSGGTISVGTAGSAYDAVVDVMTGAPGAFSEIGCNRDASGGGASRVQFNGTPATAYYIMVTAFDVSLCSGATPIVIECGGKTVFNLSGPSPAGVTASPGSTSINSGGTASYTIGTFSPPLSGSVAFTVSGCPPVSTCAFNPASVTAGSSTTLMVTTTVNGGLAPSRRFVPLIRMRTLRDLEIFALLALAFISLVISLACRVHPRGSRFPAWVPATVIFVLASTYFAGCSGLAGTVAPPPPGTPSGTYSLVVTATGNGNTTATTTAKLTVN
jgi:hypothetical protein